MEAHAAVAENSPLGFDLSVFSIHWAFPDFNLKNAPGIDNLLRQNGVRSRCICEERDATGGTTTKRFFSQGEQQGTDTLFYTRDHLGSVHELIDTTGATRARYDYDPYGRTTKASGDKDSSFTFTGYYARALSSVLLTHYRAYDPNLARWLSEDPTREAGGINLLGYVANSPINRVDPLGLWWGIDDLVFVGGGLVVGAGGRVAADLLLGSRSSTADYIGAALGGAAGAETLLYTANPFAAGAVSGLVGNGATQTLKIASGDQRSVDWLGFGFDTAIGAATGFIPGRPKIPGINSGRGSDLQVFKQIVTKAQRGLIGNIDFRTALRMGRGALAGYALGQGAAASAIGSTIYAEFCPTR